MQADIDPPGRRGQSARRRAGAALGAGLLGLLLGAAPAAAQLAAPGAEPSAAPCGEAHAPAGPRLTVLVSGARKVAGNITITLYGPRQEAFLTREGKLSRQRLTLTTTSIEACFQLSAPGDYAIAVYHDENDDHNFNRNFIGMPAEGYGFSNDAPALVGLPSFDSVRFGVPAEGRRMEIRLRY